MAVFQLSIIVPCYNTADYLEDCLLSITRHIPTRWRDTVELIVINDGSTDHTADLLSDLLPKTNLSYQLIEQTNQGLSAARNAGMAIACGRYIGFLDSDDIWLDGMQPLLAKIDTFNADIIEFNSKRFTDTEIDEYDVFKLPDTEQKLSHIKKAAFIQSDWMVWGRFYRREILSGIQFVEGITYEDVLFTSQCYIRAQSIFTYNQACVGYRFRPTSITNTNTEKDLISLNHVVAVCHQQYQLEPNDLNYFLLCNALTIYMHIYINMYKTIVGIGHKKLRQTLARNKAIKNFRLSIRLMISSLPLYLIARTVKWSMIAVLKARRS